MIFSVYRVKSKDTHSALFWLRQNMTLRDLDLGTPPIPPSFEPQIGVTKMDTATIPTWQRPEPVEEHRTNIVKVRLTDSELNLIKEKNPHASLSRFMREATLNAARLTAQIEQPKQKYSTTHKNLLIELSRIGTNVNQIARAINVDVKNLNDIHKTKLLILLLDIEKQLKELRP